MKRILEDLYFGELNPSDAPIAEGEQYNKAVHTIDENEQKLMESLSETEKMHFINFINAYDELGGIIAVHSFVSGLRFGTKLSFELLGEK